MQSEYEALRVSRSSFEFLEILFTSAPREMRFEPLGGIVISTNNT